MAYTSRVLKVIQETHDTHTIVFERPQAFNYKPGQYCIFDYHLGEELVRRSYSLSSSPTEEFLQITVKRIPNGKMSTHMTDLSEGDSVEFNGPVGKWILEDDMERVVLIAGGSGISPMRGMLKYAADKNLKGNFTLIYGARSPQDIIFHEVLEQLHREKKNIGLFITLDKPHPDWRFHVGFIDKSFITEAIGQELNQKFFLCGPPIMIDFVKKALLGLGVEEQNILLDAWG